MVLSKDELISTLKSEVRIILPVRETAIEQIHGSAEKRCPEQSLGSYAFAGAYVGIGRPGTVVPSPNG